MAVTSGSAVRSPRVALGLMLAVALALGLCPPAGSQVEAQSIRTLEIRSKEGEGVRLGLPFGSRQNKFKPGYWTPVYIDLRFIDNSAQPTSIGRDDGVIVIESVDNEGLANCYYLNWPALNPGEETTVIGYVRPASENAEVTVSVRTAEGRLLSQRKSKRNTGFEGLAPSAIVYLQLGSRVIDSNFSLRKMQAGIGLPDSVDTSRESVHEFAFIEKVEDLPTQWFGYATADVVILPTGKESFITRLLEDQFRNRREALVEWVQRGGRLILSVGRNQQLAANLLTKMPVTSCSFTGVKVGQRLDAVQAFASEMGRFPVEPFQEVEIAQLAPFPKPEAIDILPEWGTGSRPTGEPPVLLQSSSGLGRVFLIAFDLDQGQFTRWKGRHHFFRALLEKMDPLNIQQLDARALPGGRFMEPYPDLNNQLLNQLEHLEGVSVMSFGWVALFLLLYIIVVGPLDYLVLKFVVKKMELTWITFPIIVVTVSAAAYAAAHYLKGKELKIKKIDLVDIPLQLEHDSGRACSRRIFGTAWISLFSPQMQKYAIGIDPVPVWLGRPAASTPVAGNTTVSWLGHSESYFQQSHRHHMGGLFERPYRYAAAASGLKDVPIRMWAIKSFTASWHAPVASSQSDPIFSAVVRPSRTRDTLEQVAITSRLPATLRKAVLYYLDNQYDLGDLLPGQEQKIDLRARARHQGYPEWLTGMLFYKLGRGESYRNNFLRQHDQSWRLEGRKHAILMGRVIADAPRQASEAEGGYRIDNRTLSNLREAGVADSTCSKLQELKDRLVPSREEFVAALAKILDRQELDRYQERVLLHAEVPPLPTRLWLDHLPDEGRAWRPHSGTISQVTIVRVLIPVRTND